ncbi:MAG: hypothetical protein ACYCQJ_01415 [Nitrososphaerales archaeon]
MRLGLVESVLLGAFGLKLVAFIITIYTVNTGQAVEIAPIASILSSVIGIIPAGAIVNLLSFVVMIFTLSFVHKTMTNGRTKEIIKQISLILILITASSDAMWDALIILNLDILTQASVFILAILSFSAFYVKVICRRAPSALFN